MPTFPSPCVLVRKQQIDETLAVAPTQGKRSLEPFLTFAKTNNLPFNILEDSQITTNQAEVHLDEADLWFCLEGEVTFIYGGELVDGKPRQKADGTTDEREWRAKEIANGTRETLKPGDWLWIPAGQPHLHLCEGTARLIIIKIPSGRSSH